MPNKWPLLNVEKFGLKPFSAHSSEYCRNNGVTKAAEFSGSLRADIYAGGAVVAFRCICYPRIFYWYGIFRTNFRASLAIIALIACFQSYRQLFIGKLFIRPITRNRNPALLFSFYYFECFFGKLINFSYV